MNSDGLDHVTGMMRRNFSTFAKLSPFGLKLFLGVLLLFLLVVFDQQLGIIFGMMILFDIALLDVGGLNRFQYERDTSRLPDVAIGLGGFAISSVLSSFFISIITKIGQVITPGAVLTTMAAAIPALSNSPALRIISWGVLIPLIETPFFFGRVYEAVGRATKANFDLANLNTWIAMILTAIIFVLFHLTALRVGSLEAAIRNDVALALFIFAIIQMSIVTLTKELTGATYMHITQNLIAVSIQMNKLPQFVGSVLGL